jgi:hypothetical protein
MPAQASRNDSPAGLWGERRSPVSPLAQSPAQQLRAQRHEFLWTIREKAPEAMPVRLSRVGARCARPCCHSLDERRLASAVGRRSAPLQKRRR